MLAMAAKPFRFSYLYAKCKALRADTNDKEFFELLLESHNYGDIYAHLQDKKYKDFIKDPTYESIHQGLHEYFDYLYKSITLNLNDKEKVVFDLFFFGRNELVKKKELLRESKSIKAYKQLDKEFIKEYKNSLGALGSENRRDLKKIFGNYFDTLNIYTIFRLRIFYNAPIHEILPFLFPYGHEFNLEKLNNLLSLNSLSEFNAVLEPVYEQSFDDLSGFRQLLYTRHYKMLRSVWSGFPFKISIIFSLLRMKEMEMKNLKIVLEGIKYNQSKDGIRKMLLGVDM